MLKNLKLGTKLLLAFSLVALITVAIGSVGYYGVVQSNKVANQLGNESLPSIDNLLIIKSEAESIKGLVRALAIPDLSSELRKRQFEGLPKARETYTAAWAIFEKLPQTPDETALWKQFVPTWEAWREENNKAIELCKEFDSKGMPDATELAYKIEQCTKDHYLAVVRVTRLLESKEATFEGGADHTACNCGKWLATFKTDNQALASQAQALARPHQQFHEAIGKIKTLVAESKAGEARTVFQNEMTPAMADVFAQFDAIKATVNEAYTIECQVQTMVLGPIVERQTAAIALLDKLVQSHRKGAAAEVEEARTEATFMKVFSLTAMISGVVVAMLLGVFMTRSITKPIRHVADSLSLGSGQTLSAAAQVSSSSQTLAEGASEQAASLEETSASLEELSSMTRRNAENAQKTNELARQTRTAADKGAADMQNMSSAMQAIKASSDDIAKIIKTIDEIAFQTNILALNAAVEAARAGEAGMGFAVVADEVRNLAQRSAQAAKETAAKIEGAITKTKQGVEINSQVAQTLNDIVTKARHMDELAAEVAGASLEQTQGITQINTAVNQMDKVTQSNAANAEESAAAAEELNAQAETMKQSVNELIALVGGTNTAFAQAPSVRRTPHDHAIVANARIPMPQKTESHETKNLITWDESRMATGVESIDEQHQELIGMINKLHRACLAGVGKEELRQMMHFLAAYVKTHFEHEEGLMEQHRCPSKTANLAAHQKFLQNFEKLRQEFEAHGASTSLLLDMRSLIGDWLGTHICAIDTKLRQCPSAQNRNSAFAAVV